MVMRALIVGNARQNSANRVNPFPGAELQFCAFRHGLATLLARIFSCLSKGLPERFKRYSSGQVSPDIFCRCGAPGRNDPFAPL